MSNQEINFVVEFVKLPFQYRTSEVRKKYDTDGSGFLEFYNNDRKNEIQTIEQELGLDLSKYRTEVKNLTTTTVPIEDGVERHSKAEFANGTKVTYVFQGNNAYGAADRVEEKGDRREVVGLNKNMMPYNNISSENLRPHRRGNDDWFMTKLTEEKNVEYRGQKGLTKTEFVQDAGGVHTITRYEKGTKGSPDYYFAEVTTLNNSDIPDFAQEIRYVDGKEQINVYIDTRSKKLTPNGSLEEITIMEDGKARTIYTYKFRNPEVADKHAGQYERQVVEDIYQNMDGSYVILAEDGYIYLDKDGNAYNPYYKE